ncbi:polysaccharide pyruvyl transferase family protein [Vibrio hepatarius]|uniref:polysaccharide pyruvyl transferase family protein n=1 Tax=Vibrio hepatarius TaxID=171383 RepID=UPI003735C068
MSHDSIPNSYQLQTPHLMKHCGFNFGNFAFRFGLANMTPLDDAIVGNCDLDVEKGTKVEKIILSCANWVSESAVDEEKNRRRYEFLEKYDCPVFSFGLGIQTKHSNGKMRLGESTKRLLHLLSKRGNLLSLRDGFTQKALADIGIYNTEVTGCPSNFINIDSQLPEHIYRHSKYLLNENKLSTLRAHITECSSIDEHSKALNKMMAYLKKYPSFYILQSPELIPFLRDRGAFSGAYPKGYQDLIKNKSRYFIHFLEWLEFCRTCDFSFGMRIHGNMIPLQAARPALLIKHDIRTKGLADVMGIPSITVDEFSKIRSSALVKTVLQKNIDGMELFSNQRKESHKKFIELLLSNNLDICSDFETMYKGG